jgi:putative flippase GtrA
VKNASTTRSVAEPAPDRKVVATHLVRTWKNSFWQVVRFGIVGVCNTAIDVLVLNLLLWSFPTQNMHLLLLYNSLAFISGTCNSYIFNKYWTFRHRQRPTGSELSRFAIVNGVGFLCNNGILWIAAGLVHRLLTNTVLWANVAKLSAIVGTATITYLGMRLWVFVNLPHNKERERIASLAVASDSQKRPSSDHLASVSSTTHQLEAKKSTFRTNLSLSAVLPAYNEEATIAQAVQAVVEALAEWVPDFEVIVVNDGSKDCTGAIVETIAAADPRVRLINHPINQGYGAALVSGFEATTKDLAFFMDSDGQFDIRDLERFFPLIGEYDAVLGYRTDRQDSWMRKCNAWGWKTLVNCIFRLGIRDVDCAFKLYRADFFRGHRLETRGAMINTEILYKFRRAGYTYTQLGVRHLPRRSGQATGAKPAVIARALHELFVHTWKWYYEERKRSLHSPKTT